MISVARSAVQRTTERPTSQQILLPAGDFNSVFLTASVDAQQCKVMDKHLWAGHGHACLMV